MAKVKVRIAVAVDTDGEWAAAGWMDANDHRMANAALSDVSLCATVYWLDAELDVPQEPVVQAVVTKAGEP